MKVSHYLGPDGYLVRLSIREARATLAGTLIPCLRLLLLLSAYGAAASAQHEEVRQGHARSRPNFQHAALWSRASRPSSKRNFKKSIDRDQHMPEPIEKWPSPLVLNPTPFCSFLRRIRRRPRAPPPSSLPPSSSSSSSSPSQFRKHTVPP